MSRCAPRDYHSIGYNYKATTGDGTAVQLNFKVGYVGSKPDLGARNLGYVTYHCYTPLHFASRKCHVPTMKLLIRHKANFNAINNWNQTPLEMSLAKQSETSDEDNKQAQKLLIRHGGLIGSDVQKKVRDELIEELRS